MSSLLFTVTRPLLESVSNIAAHTKFFDDIEFFRFFEDFVNVDNKWVIYFLEDIVLIEDLSVIIDIDHLGALRICTFSVFASPHTRS